MQKGDMMDDTISRQAAIRWVKTECNPYGKPTLEFESGVKVIEHLEQMPTAQPEPQWIPCSERFPDEEDVYLCCSTAQDIWILRYVMPYYFKEGAFIQFDGDYPEEFSDVIAWMPLPDCYKGE